MSLRVCAFVCHCVCVPLCVPLCVSVSVCLCRCVCVPVQPFLSPSASVESVNRRYQLAALVQHEGRGIDTGHYTAFCHDPVRDTWLHFNDTAVKVVTPQKVEAAQVRPFLLVACSLTKRAGGHVVL